jgi:peptidoglycan/xylan/chitin deacetylase (PgdA/CDA1 family)
MKMTLRIIKLLIALIAIAADIIKRTVFSLVNRKYPGTCVALYYHSITKEQSKRFAKQMDDIVRWTHPIDISKEKLLDHGIRHTIVTFDDGFSCVLENAVPELRSRNIPAIIFIPVGYISSRPGWITNERETDFDEIVMSLDELVGVQKDILIKIGSHCVSHCSMMSLDDERAMHEIICSKHRLEEILSTTIDMLCFPHGEYSDKHLFYAKSAGYKRLFSIVPKEYHDAITDFVIGRVRVDPWDWRIEFKLKILGAYSWLPYAYNAKKTVNNMMRKYCYIKD